MKREDKIELAFVVVLTLLLSILAVCFSGCTTATHEPMCTCDCNQTNAHFKCSGLLENHELDIK